MLLGLTNLSLWNDKVLEVNTEANWLHKESAIARRAYTWCNLAHAHVPLVYFDSLGFDLGITAKCVVWSV